MKTLEEHQNALLELQKDITPYWQDAPAGPIRELALKIHRDLDSMIEDMEDLRRSGTERSGE